jgi:hypothetical protein
MAIGNYTSIFDSATQVVLPLPLSQKIIYGVAIILGIFFLIKLIGESLKALLWAVALITTILLAQYLVTIIK